MPRTIVRIPLQTGKSIEDERIQPNQMYGEKNFFHQNRKPAQQKHQEQKEYHQYYQPIHHVLLVLINKTKLEGEICSMSRTWLSNFNGLSTCACCVGGGGDEGGTAARVRGQDALSGTSSLGEGDNSQGASHMSLMYWRTGAPLDV